MFIETGKFSEEMERSTVISFCCSFLRRETTEECTPLILLDVRHPKFAIFVVIHTFILARAWFFPLL